MWQSRDVRHESGMWDVGCVMSRRGGTYLYYFLIKYGDFEGGVG